jgi:hypothetical protein
MITLTALALSAGCKTEEFPSGWATAAVTVDGNMDDWMDLPCKHFTDANAAISIANDSEYLYLLFRTNDPHWARTIKTSGLTVYFNNRGKEDKDFLVRFRGGPSLDQIMAVSGRGENLPDRPPLDGDRFDSMTQDQEPHLSCFIKDRIIEKPIPLDGSQGPAAASDTSQGFFAYEMRIPLDSGTVRYYGIGAEPGQKIAIGAEWGSMEGMRSERPDGMGPGMGGPPMGQPGGSRPGGMGGRGGGPGMGRPEMPQKQEVWIKTVLAKPETPASDEE